jgi:ribonuclease VapC
LRAGSLAGGVVQGYLSRNAEGNDGDGVRLAGEAYRCYGKGSGHAARLNFCDCFAYALAIDRDEPLLFKGDDFARTDVKRALP